MPRQMPAQYLAAVGVRRTTRVEASTIAVHERLARRDTTAETYETGALLLHALIIGLDFHSS